MCKYRLPHYDCHVEVSSSSLPLTHHTDDGQGRWSQLPLDQRMRALDNDAPGAEVDAEAAGAEATGAEAAGEMHARLEALEMSVSADGRVEFTCEGAVTSAASATHAQQQGVQSAAHVEEHHLQQHRLEQQQTMAKAVAFAAAAAAVSRSSARGNIGVAEEDAVSAGGGGGREGAHRDLREVEVGEGAQAAAEARARERGSDARRRGGGGGCLATAAAMAHCHGNFGEDGDPYRDAHGDTYGDMCSDDGGDGESLQDAGVSLGAGEEETRCADVGCGANEKDCEHLPLMLTETRIIKLQRAEYECMICLQVKTPQKRREGQGLQVVREHIHENTF
jgi:hypothetical protein